MMAIMRYVFDTRRGERGGAENFINEQSFFPTRDLEDIYIYIYNIHGKERREESVPEVNMAYANRG